MASPGQSRVMEQPVVFSCDVVADSGVHHLETASLPILHFPFLSPKVPWDYTPHPIKC